MEKHDVLHCYIGWSDMTATTAAGVRENIEKCTQDNPPNALPEYYDLSIQYYMATNASDDRDYR